MGASVQIVMWLLSREIIWLLVISALISIPAFFGVKAWIQKFEYHINFNVGDYFLILGAITLFVLVLVMLTVSYHSYKHL